MTHESSGEAKIALYRSLFDGRADVYPRRWENTSRGTSGWSPAHRGSWNTPRDQRQYLPLTDEVVRGHLLLVATDRYFGEGFDCPKLDTLFLAFPISARQRITQYVGRILRDQPGKDIAEVHDDLDAGVPMLAAMYRRRLPGYEELGFTPGSSQSASPPHRGVAVAASARASCEPDREPTAAQVRAWARAAGYAVSDRGRLPADLWDAYHNAHR